MALDIDKMRREMKEALDKVSNEELDNMLRDVRRERMKRGPRKWKDLSAKEKELTLIVAAAAIIGTLIGITIGVLSL